MARRTKLKADLTPKVILFDFDGVLVDAGSLVWEAYNGLKGSHPTRRFAKKSHLLSETKRTVIKTLRHIGVPLYRLPAALLAVRRRLGKRYRPELSKGVAPVVRRLSRQYTLAVVSTNQCSTIRDVLRMHGMEQFFTGIFCTNYRGSKVQALKRACRRLNTDCSDALFITDTTYDVEDARKAGIPVYGVAWGFHSKDKLLKAGARRIFKTPQEIMRFING